MMAVAVVLCSCAARQPVATIAPPPALRLNYLGEIKGRFGSSEFSAPTAIVFDISNNLYILDRGNNRVVKLSSDYRFVQENGGYGLGLTGLNNPVALASDGGVNFFILDQGNSRIIRSDYNLVFSDELRFNYNPDLQLLGKIAGLAYSRFGNMYLVDPDNLKVVVLDKDYARQQELFPAGGFAHCALIRLAAAGDVYVYDRDRNTIYIFDSFGNPDGKIALSGVGELGDFEPQSEQLIATDKERNELVVLGRDGSVIAATGSSGGGGLNFANPTGLAVRADGKIFVCDTGNNRIVIYEIAAALP